MKRKTKICRVLGAFFCVIIIARAMMPQIPAASVSALTTESIREKEAQVEQARRDKENLMSGLTDLQALKTQLESKRTNLKNYVAELDDSLAVIERKVEDLKQQIADKEEEITLTESELDAAVERENDQMESMIRYIRYSYEMGTPRAMDILLASVSFSDLLNRADYMERVAAYEHMLWQDYKNIREYVELCREQLELEWEFLEQTRANVETEQQNLEELIEQKTRDIISYETDINTKAAAIRELEQEIKAEEEVISALEAAIAEEKRQLLENSSTVISYDGGVFKFPLATYTRISDEYGMRIHPTLGVEQFHNGVDFASPKGTDIYAAYDGKVVAATYNATMGNYIMIDHGSSLFTIYMHASALYVKEGDVVVRGETIAAVGTTGRSTGNHLHFSVRLNGEYVSPWNYLSK